MTIFYTICFSLGDPTKNRYIDCLALLYRSLQLSNSIGVGDRFMVACDTPTASVLKHMKELQGVMLAVFPTPTSLKDGMSLKYRLRDKGDNLYVYLDTDILVRRPFKPVIDPDTLYVFPEGRPTDTNYCGKAETPLPFPVGFTAGLFAYRSGPRVFALFDEILADLKRGDETFYTLDQPYFNHRMVGHRIQVAPQRLVSFNGHGLSNDTVIVNLAGEPGNGDLHLDKMKQMFSALLNAKADTPVQSLGVKA